MMLLMLLACGGDVDTGTPSQDRGALTDTTPGPGGPSGPGPGAPGPGASDDTAPPAAGSDTGDADEVDTGASWTGEPGDYALTHDGRDLWLHVPEGYDASAPIPLVIGFHGAGDSGADFNAVVSAYGWTAAATSAGFALLIPDTKSPYSDFAIWSGNPNDDVDEMIAELDEVLAIADWLGDTWRLDPAQRHLFGFSDGGLFTAVAGMSRASTVASLTVVGYGWGSFYPLVTPPRLLPVQFACGSSDSFHSYAQDSESYLSGQGHDTRMLSVSGAGHSFSGVMGGASPDDLAAWMLARPLP